MILFNVKGGLRMAEFDYPFTRKTDQVDDFHGTKVADPYRWLEDTDSPETRTWIEAQNELTFSFLREIPEREKILKRLSELWDYAKAGAPLKKGSHYFQLRNSGLQNQDVLFVMETLGDQGRVLLDPNELSSDGTVALVSWSVSKDGRWIAYATSASGSDWMTWKVRDVNTGEDTLDRVEWSKFSGASWLPDSSGFFYSAYDAPQDSKEFQGSNYFQKVYFHSLGEQQSQDRLIYHRPDHKEWGFDARVSDDGKYLIFSVWLGTDVRNRLFYQELGSAAPVVELIDELGAAYQFVGNDGPVFYLQTDLDAPRRRLIAVDVRHPAKEDWRTLVAEHEDALELTKMVNNQFLCLYLHDAHHRLLRYSLEGAELGEISFATMGSIVLVPEWNFNGERQDDELFYAFQSFVHPTTIYRYDFSTDKSSVLFSPPIDYDFSDYETRQVFVSSRDGTRIPMFLVHRRDLEPDRRHATLLYGYGGFNISITPSFLISRLIWLEMGGVLAVANLRGGGEYGEVWHQAGMILNKQNVFDDFIACAQYLIDEGITARDKLVIQGRSNGGLLVGACLTQRPDLFGAALPAVGVMDMLRFHQFTIGWGWVSDYGSVENEQEFKVLHSYSPLHNIKAGQHYPATLITTADHDDRVVPGHSFKFAAALQAAQAGEKPILIRIQTKAGHGFGKPTALLIEEEADIWAFLVKVLGL
jgi:prolyl oligopeptidase